MNVHLLTPCASAGVARAGLLPVAPPAPWPLAAFGALVDWSVVAMGATMITLVFFNVCLHVVGHDLAWVIELAELLMVWATFLGGACATRRGAQMTINEFIDKLGDAGARRAADAAVNLFTAAILLALIVFGVRLAAAGWGNELSVLGIAMTWQYAGMPVGAAAMLVWVLWDLVRTSRGDSRAQRWGD